jgi:hypothetical protein
VFSTTLTNISAVTTGEVDLTLPAFASAFGAPVKIQVALSNTSTGGGSLFLIGDFTLQTSRTLGVSTL